MKNLELAACRGKTELTVELENPLVARTLIRDHCRDCRCRRDCLVEGLDLVDIIKSHRLLTVIDEDREMGVAESNRQQEADADLSNLPIVYGGRTARELEQIWKALPDKSTPELECCRCGQATHPADYDLDRMACRYCLDSLTTTS